MKSVCIRFFPIVFALILFISCKNNTKAPIDTNPVFQDPALKGITNQISNDPTNAALYYNRGNILHKMDKDSLALNDYKKASTLDSSKAIYFSAVGNLLFDHKDITGSIPWLQKAIALDPKDPKAHLKIAKMFLYTKDYQKAFNEINVVLRRDVYNPEPYFLKGLLYADMKDTTRAISSYLTALQVAPDYKDAAIELADLYNAKKDPVALKYYDRSFELDTTDAYPLFAKGVYYQNINNYEQAKKEYTNCILHDNQYADAYFNMGYVLLQQDSTAKARRQYDLVTKIEPNNPRAYYNRGLCSELMHQKEDAISDYRQALVFDSKYKDAQDGLKRLGATVH